MKIFIDARTAHVGGINTYATNLLSALLEIDTKNEYFVLYDKRMGERGLVRAREIAAPTMNHIVWIVWNETSLPDGSYIVTAEKNDVQTKWYIDPMHNVTRVERIRQGRVVDAIETHMEIIEGVSVPVSATYSSSVVLRQLENALRK